MITSNAPSDRPLADLAPIKPDASRSSLSMRGAATPALLDSLRAASCPQNTAREPQMALAVHGVTKRYEATQALCKVSLSVARGSIHALLGGNGSGKSTLIKILAGVVDADSGEVTVAGATHLASSIDPALSRAAGIRVVHQHSSTFPDLTVAENLSLGRGFEKGVAGRIDWRGVYRRTAEVLARFGIEAAPGQKLSELRPAAQMMVAIARALQDQEDDTDGILILDEPTAALSAAEVERLSRALKRYAAAGQTIIIVTHRLEEVLELADHVTVLRDGEVAGDMSRDEVTHNGLVSLISPRGCVARERVAATMGGVMLDIRGLRGGPVRGVDLSLHRGEVLGIAGLVGSGRTGLLQLLFGLRQPEQGMVTLDGRPYRPRSAAEAMRAGAAFVPEDRIADASFHDLTVCQNMSIAGVGRFWSGWKIDHALEESEARSLVQALALRPQRTDLPIGKLSGGNQQKVVLGRWLARKPRLLLLDEPSQGVDIAARGDIHALVRRAAAQGAAALVVSSDFSELAQLCDRVVVPGGRPTAGEVGGKELDCDRIHEMAYAKDAA